MKKTTEILISLNSYTIQYYVLKKYRYSDILYFLKNNFSTYVLHSDML